MTRRIGWGWLLGISAVAGGLCGVPWLQQWQPTAQAQTSRGNSAPPVVTDLVAVGDRFELVARRVLPAVVSVEARKMGGKRATEDAGSGVIVRWPGRSDYLVLTNNHVVTGADPSSIIVTLSDGRLLRPKQVWADTPSDVAVLSLEGASDLPTAELGDSDRMRVGQWVLAMGSPFGLNQSVTHGIISARGRGQISLGDKIRIKDFLQTDASINPGSSGGPLVNLNGEVVGINTAIASPSGSSSGVAFSIPSNLIRRIGQELLDKGQVTRGYLGLQVSATFDPFDAAQLGLNRAWGAMVEAVIPGEPAAQAGLRAGDVILELDNIAIRNENHFINEVSFIAPGKTIVLVIWRDRRRQALSLTIADFKEAEQRLRLGSK
jgi:S1-C subfamily serine protease